MTRFRLAIIATLCLAASLLLARVHPFGNAGLYAPSDPNAAIMNSAVPADVRALLNAKCADCHSSQTNAPIYAHFAPISWLPERDITQARAAMDLSHWTSYSPDQQDTLTAKIVQQAKSGTMPPLQYRIIHWNTRLTAADIHTLTQWAHADPSTDPTPPATLLPGDPVRGQATFEKRCTGCHPLDHNHEGPRLQGVYGRPAGSIPGFPYSDALKHANLTWNDQTLEQWLTDPDAFLPGNNMDFHVPRPQERKDIIAYFKQSAGK